MASVSDDRRVRRTRRLLREALLELMQEKGYDHVTVQDVLDRADVGRATFYTHFRDKDDLFLSGSGEIREAFRLQLAAAARGQPDDAAAAFGQVIGVFQHIAESRPLYRAMVRSRAGDLVLGQARETVVALLREHFDQRRTNGGTRPAVPVEVMVQYLASALMGTITWWLEEDREYGADDMERMFLRLSQAVVATASGTES